MADASLSPVEEVLANARERVTILRAEGHPIQANSLERLADDIRAALPEFLTWLPEDQASTYTGRTADFLRQRFAGLEARGLARWSANGKAREYRRCALQHRGNVDAAREAGRRAARGNAA